MDQKKITEGDCARCYGCKHDPLMDEPIVMLWVIPSDNPGLRHKSGYRLTPVCGRCTSYTKDHNRRFLDSGQITARDVEAMGFTLAECGL